MRRALIVVVAAAALVIAPAAGAWTWPVKGPVLETFVLGDDPYAAGQHRGIDIGAPAGAPVLAPASGTVSFAGTVPVSGRTVTIKTTDGYSVTLTHLGSMSVQRGETVVEGVAVGTIGPSGEVEHDVPYLHLGIRRSEDPNGYVDPLLFLPAPAAPSAAPAPTPPATPAVSSAPAPPVSAGAASPPVASGRQLRDHSSNRIAGRRGGWGGRASSSRRTGCSPRVAHESRRRDWCSAWSDCSSRCGNNSLETRSVAKQARATVDACDEDRSRDAGRRKRPERRNGDSRPADAHLPRHSLALAGGVAPGRSSNRGRPAPASRLGLARARAYHCHKCRATT